MARRKPAGPIKDFSNVDEVFDKMLEFSFFANEAHRDQRKAELTDETFSPHSSNEFWFSNHYLEIKIFKGMFGAYTLCNFRGLIHDELDSLFEVARLSKNGS